MSALVALRTDGGLLGAILSDFFRGVGDVKGEEGSCWVVCGIVQVSKKVREKPQEFPKMCVGGSPEDTSVRTGLACTFSVRLMYIFIITCLVRLAAPGSTDLAKGGRRGVEFLRN